MFRWFKGTVTHLHSDVAYFILQVREDWVKDSGCDILQGALGYIYSRTALTIFSYSYFTWVLLFRPLSTLTRTHFIGKCHCTTIIWQLKLLYKSRLLHRTHEALLKCDVLLNLTQEHLRRLLKQLIERKLTGNYCVDIKDLILWCHFELGVIVMMNS